MTILYIHVYILVHTCAYLCILVHACTFLQKGLHTVPDVCCKFLGELIEVAELCSHMQPQQAEGESGKISQLLASLFCEGQRLYVIVILDM